jgi:Protein of unknown function (DUF1549)/Protein of unknown function (DUF1553)/Concanavalin A-like lectin/glucanases superfamily/Planctomycete cytochrome C
VRAFRFGVAISLVSVAIALVSIACRKPAPAAIAGVPDVVDFNFHVKPILSDRCFKCHGPDDRVRKASLRFDVREGAFAELPSGRHAVVAGDTGRSEMVRRILSTDPKVMMPAPDSLLSLTDTERAILVRWVEQGAEWKPHWAFIPPARPAVPTTTRHDWSRNEIDRFVLAGLDSRGLRPSPEASRETLLRRVSMDLTGLPPTLADIDAFVADRSPEAYERVVDRLLASPAYGERMAVEWLDIARYADSHGYQDDGMRTMWPWRDWVISAFNRNMPLDRFITWQLAGDLLPSATDEQRLATGFNRNHMQSQEGGIVSEEYRVEYVADRVNTLGRAFLGVSVECARCHDHKYDPISQKDYFRLFGFFNSINESGQIPYSGVPSPAVMVVDAKTQAALDRVRAELATLEPGLRPEGQDFDRRFAVWLAKSSTTPRRAQHSPHGLIGHLPFDGAVRTMERPKTEPKEPPKPPEEVVAYENLATPRQRATAGGDKDKRPQQVPGRFGNALRLPGDSYITIGKEFAYFERNQPFSLSLWVRLDKEGTSGPLIARSGGVMNGNRGYEILLRADGTLSAGLHHVGPDNSIEIETIEKLVTGSWYHLGLTYDGSSRVAGLRLFLDGAPARTRALVDNLHRSIIYTTNKGTWGDVPPLRLGKRQDETTEGVAFDEVRLYDRQVSALDMAALGGHDAAVARALDTPAASRTAGQLAQLREHFMLDADAEYASTLSRATALRKQENDLLTALTEVMTMRDLPSPRPTFVLARGAYDAPTTRVEPGTPAVMGAFPSAQPANRLGLARWLLNPAHPLTARVTANRYWALLFGRGLVPTLADFGSQGQLPSHPALLDWLATTLVQSGWDLKAFQKRLVMSATYRQSSIADAARREADSGNAWLSRGPSHRLAAEQIRDAALATSGLLVPTIGGPSVYPYQPPGLWEALATRNATTYTPGHGPDLYRRSLYTVWKRSSPPPSATSFDAAERLFCTVNRQRTSTPLQALVLLNDPQYVEAARKLGERMILEGGQALSDRVAIAFRLLTGRTPLPSELALLEKLYADERAAFVKNPGAARRLLAAGEAPRNAKLPAADVAAASVVASTVMNMDEAVMKR